MHHKKNSPQWLSMPKMVMTHFLLVYTCGTPIPVSDPNRQTAKKNVPTSVTYCLEYLTKVHDNIPPPQDLTPSLSTVTQRNRKIFQIGEDIPNFHFIGFNKYGRTYCLFPQRPTCSQLVLCRDLLYCAGQYPVFLFFAVFSCFKSTILNLLLLSVVTLPFLAPTYGATLFLLAVLSSPLILGRTLRRFGLRTTANGINEEDRSLLKARKEYMQQKMADRFL